MLGKILVFLFFAILAGGCAAGFGQAYVFSVEKTEFLAFLGSLAFGAAFLSYGLIGGEILTSFHQKIVFGMFLFSTITVSLSSVPYVGYVAGVMAFITGLVAFLPEGKEERDDDWAYEE